jgi:hypothetical protein
MLREKESQLEISLNWFDKWRFNWSCSESAWKKYSEKLASPLNKGVAIGIGVVIGLGVAAYTSAQVIHHIQMTPIEAPASTK